MFCFDCNSIECNCSENYGRNNIINKFLLAGDKSMPEMHIRQPQFTYSVFDHLLKMKKESKN